MGCKLNQGQGCEDMPISWWNRQQGKMCVGETENFVHILSLTLYHPSIKVAMSRQCQFVTDILKLPWISTQQFSKSYVDLGLHLRQRCHKATWYSSGMVSPVSQGAGSSSDLGLWSAACPTSGDNLPQKSAQISPNEKEGVEATFTVLSAM